MPVLFDIRSALTSYSVVLERNALPANAQAMREGVVITDAYFEGQFAERGISAIALPAEEATKSLDSIANIIVRMREAGVTRDTHLWAVGGGAIQDVAGFVASIYMRGIPWTYLPTTLLGMVDSCVGGKSSINVGSYKNIVGTFHTPTKVLVDSSLISTLSIEQRIAGLVEAAKICYCRGPEVFEKYLAVEPDCNSATEGFESIVALSLGAKKWFVEVDEFDRGERLLLNLGHTFGHALEGASQYRLSHGIAVGVGVLCALALSRGLLRHGPGGAAASLESHMAELLGSMPELPRIVQGIGIEDAFERVKSDKKHEAKNYRFVTLDADGRVQISRLPKTEATRAAVIEAMRTTWEFLLQ